MKFFVVVPSVLTTFVQGVAGRRIRFRPTWRDIVDWLDFRGDLREPRQGRGLRERVDLIRGG